MIKRLYFIFLGLINMTSYKYIYHNDLLLPDGNPQFLSCNDRTSLVFENVKINGSDQTTMSVNQGIIYNNPSTYNITFNNTEYFITKVQFCVPRVGDNTCSTGCTLEKDNITCSSTDKTVGCTLKTDYYDNAQILIECNPTDSEIGKLRIFIDVFQGGSSSSMIDMMINHSTLEFNLNIPSYPFYTFQYSGDTVEFKTTGLTISDADFTKLKKLSLNSYKLEDYIIYTADLDDIHYICYNSSGPNSVSSTDKIYIRCAPESDANDVGYTEILKNNKGTNIAGGFLSNPQTWHVLASIVVGFVIIAVFIAIIKLFQAKKSKTP
jgi:hypothetical protein